MTHNKRDRLRHATTVLFMTVNSTPAGHELIQAKKRELINLGVIKEGGTNGRNEDNQPTDPARCSA